MFIKCTHSMQPLTPVRTSKNLGKFTTYSHATNKQTVQEVEVHIIASTMWVRNST